MLARLVTVGFLLVYAALFPGEAQSQEDLGRRIESLFDACDRSDAPGGFAAAVLRDGRILFEGAYGFSNSEHHVPFNTHTVTDLASVAKQFTGFAVATMVGSAVITPATSVHNCTSSASSAEPMTVAV